MALRTEMQKPNSIEAIAALANRIEALARGKSKEGLKVLSKLSCYAQSFHTQCMYYKIKVSTS